MSTTLEKAKIISSVEDLPQEARTVGVLGALLGVDNDGIIQGMISVMNNNDTQQAEKKYPLKGMPKDYTPTQKMLHKMLTENSGVHMMDSGGVYGRHWQQNRLVNDFRLQPRIVVQTDEWNNVKQFTLGKSLFHYLDERLEYDAGLSYKFLRFANRKSQKDEYWMSNIIDFIESIDAHDDGDGNSYNHENLLSQDFQWHAFTYYNIQYVIIQTHNGADIRGGYSTPRVFRVNDELANLFDFAYVNAGCSCSESTTYDGYHWDGSEDKFPKVWHVSTRKGGVYCQECKEEVSFT